jgi:hypothetical protein
MDYTDHAHGSYQMSLLTGWARWSGSDISNKWGARYHASRLSLLARLKAAGVAAEIRDFKNANNRIMCVLYIDDVPVSATS